MISTDILRQNMDRMLELHRQRATAPDWTLTYCDLQFIPWMFGNLRKNGVARAGCIIETGQMERLCEDIRAIFRPDYLQAYCAVIDERYQKFAQKRSQELALELYFYWIHLCGFCYLASLDDEFSCHDLLQRYIAKLALFITDICKMPMPEGWLELADFFLSQYRQKYPCDLDVPRDIARITIDFAEMYRITHIVLQKTRYFQQPLGDDREIIEEMIALAPSYREQFGLHVDAFAEFFLILRACSNYSGNCQKPALSPPTITALAQFEKEYLQSLQENLQQLLKHESARVQNHSLLTVPLYLSTVMKYG